MRNDFILRFGPGEFSIRWKQGPRKRACQGFVEYRPSGLREKIVIKIEMWLLKPDALPEMNKLVFGSLHAVSTMAQRGELRVPPFGSVIQVETPEEILSDKVRALLGRRDIKGRDFHDKEGTRPGGSRTEPRSDYVTTTSRDAIPSGNRSRDTRNSRGSHNTYPGSFAARGGGLSPPEAGTCTGSHPEAEPACPRFFPPP